MSFEITLGQLAADGAGLPFYVDEDLRSVNKAAAKLKEEEKAFKITAIILAALIVSAGAIGGSLIACSGGPSNLSLFVPGVIFSGIFLSLVIIMIVRILDSRQESQRINKVQEDYPKRKITAETALKEMLDDPKTKSEQVTAVMNNLVGLRKKFVLYVWDCFKDDTQPFPTGKGKVLSGIANSDAMERIDFKTMSRAFNIEMLKRIEPKKVESKQGKELFKKLYEALGEPQSKMEVKQYGHHPAAIALLAQSDPPILQEATLKTIVEKMSRKNRSAYAQAMDEAIEEEIDSSSSVSTEIADF
jgi:hypothetical protein